MVKLFRNRQMTRELDTREVIERFTSTNNGTKELDTQEFKTRLDELGQFRFNNYSSFIEILEDL
jgi:hypothetical protein